MRIYGGEMRLNNKREKEDNKKDKNICFFFFQHCRDINYF